MSAVRPVGQVSDTAQPRAVPEYGGWHHDPASGEYFRIVARYGATVILDFTPHWQRLKKKHAATSVLTVCAVFTCMLAFIAAACGIHYHVLAGLTWVYGPIRENQSTLIASNGVIYPSRADFNWHLSDAHDTFWGLVCVSSFLLLLTLYMIPVWFFVASRVGPEPHSQPRQSVENEKPYGAAGFSQASEIQAAMGGARNNAEELSFKD